jgi:hypothetical protein
MKGDNMPDFDRALLFSIGDNLHEFVQKHMRINTTAVANDYALDGIRFKQLTETG